jgi:TPR repeat protein
MLFRQLSKQLLGRNSSSHLGLLRSITVHSSTDSTTTYEVIDPTNDEKQRQRHTKLSPQEVKLTQKAFDGHIESQHRLGMFYLAKAKGQEPRFPHLTNETTNDDNQHLTEEERGKQKADAVVLEIRAQQRANSKIRRNFVKQSRNGLTNQNDTTMTALMNDSDQKNNQLKQQGVKWLLKSHESGYVDSTIALANVMYENIRQNGKEGQTAGTIQHVNKIVSLWKSTSPHPDSCFNLGKLYYDGIDAVPEFNIDRKESMKWFNLASDEGDAASKYWLGYVHHNGDEECGVVPNNDIAIQFLEEAASLNHADAAMYLYSLYRNGDSGDVTIDINMELAWKYLLLAKDQGSSEALNVLADLHFHGLDGLDVDQTIALRYYLEAGDLGHSNALCSAGAMFFHGLGTERNFTKSYQLYQHAVDADSENKEAWRNLASCYYHGHGTKKDVKLAKTILDTVLKDE